MLSTSNLSVAEIAYQLRFERPQSLNRLFKKKTSVSPLEYRESFNQGFVYKNAHFIYSAQYFQEIYIFTAHTQEKLPTRN